MTSIDFLRASYTKRWTIVNTSRQQTIAEHSFNVAMIAQYLAELTDWNGVFHSSEVLQLQSWALLHDIVEIYTGDIPTPFKRALEKHGAKISDAEEEFLKEYGGAAREAEQSIFGVIVKFADMLEAIWFLKDHGIGDHASKVLSGLYENLYSMVDKYEAEYPNLNIRKAVAEIRKEMHI